jgi:hypothetical protein
VTESSSGFGAGTGHYELMPGNVLGVGSVAPRLRGGAYTAKAPRWTCPALYLASWNFTGGASG